MNAFGANCGHGPWDTAGIIRQMFEAVPGAILIAKPNAGIPELDAGTPSYPVEPARFAQLARDWIRAGARIVGGCCGSTPKHIEAIRTEISGKTRKTSL